MERMGEITNAKEVMSWKRERKTTTWTHTLNSWSVTT